MPLTKGLLIATGVSFLLHSALQVWLQSPFGAVGVLATGQLSLLTPLQVVTHPLAWIIKPRSAIELFFELAMLWFSIGAFEERFGTRTTAKLVVAAGLLPGLAAMLVGLAVRPDLVAGPGVWVFAGWSALGWSLRNTPMSFLGMLPMKGVGLVWFAVALVVLNFVTDPRVPTLVAELSAIGVGVAFVEWLSRPARYRTSTVVPIGDARAARERKNKKEWLN